MKFIKAPNRHAYIGNLALEVLRGCRHNCSGCMVEKNLPITTSEEVDIEELTEMAKTAVENGYRVDWLEIAPTDIMSADNRISVLTNDTIKNMVQYFDLIVFNSTFLDPKQSNYDDLAKLIDNFAPGKNIEFLTPLELKHCENISYLEGIRSRISYLSSKLTSAKIISVTARINVSMGLVEKKLFDGKVFAKIFDFGFYELYSPPAFVFHQGRTGLYKAEEKIELLELISIQNYEFAKYFKNNSNFRVDDLSEGNGMDLHMVYREGSLYFNPLINSHIPILNEEFKVSKPWSLESIESQDRSRYLENLSLIDKTDDCSSCRFVSKCASRDIMKLQQFLDTGECLSILSRLSDSPNW